MYFRQFCNIIPVALGETPGLTPKVGQHGNDLLFPAHDLGQEHFIVLRFCAEGLANGIVITHIQDPGTFHQHIRQHQQHQVKALGSGMTAHEGKEFLLPAQNTGGIHTGQLGNRKAVPGDMEFFIVRKQNLFRMAVVGIVMKFFQIVISVVIGMAAGCIPIVGYNIGAKLNKRVKTLFTKLLIYEACIGAVAFIIVELFPNVLIQIFGAANESVYYTDFAVKAFRIYLCMIVLACINKATFIFLQAMGKAVESTILSMVREIVFGVGLTLLLPLFFGLDGVLYSMPVSDVLTAIISAILIAKTYRQLNTI